jgi:hypothetical protein
MKKIFALFFLVFLTSCTQNIYYTFNVRRDLESIGMTPNKLQFYTDSQIILQRKINEFDKKVDDGKVKINSKVTRDVVVIGDRIGNAMGICKKYESSSLDIYFEEGDEQEKKMLFVLNKNGYYQLPPTNYNRYDGSLYEVVEGRGARLKIKKSVYTKYVTKRRKVKGLRIQDDN